MFEITYHRKIRDDISTLSRATRSAMHKAIVEKLTDSPALFGKPLRFSLAGLRSLRVGDYRVIFELKKNEVFVVLIAHRSVVYKSVRRGKR